MSSLIETYALACGVKISSPEINEEFYPLGHPFEKSILIHAFAGGVNNNQATFPAKIYDNFYTVLKLIRPELDKAGFKIFQIGGAGEPSLPDTESLCGKTNIHQTAFLLKNCALLIGNDSMNGHIAASYGTPVVILYGPTCNKNHGPFWKQKAKLLESHRFGAKRPSYQAFEPDKTINTIPPEEVANAVFELLGISKRIDFSTTYLNSVYNNQILEVIPEVVIDKTFAPNAILNIRMDYHFDEQKLVQNLIGHKSSITTDRKISLDIINKLRDKISNLRVKINDQTDIDFILAVKKMNISHQFFTEDLEGEELSALRLKFFDYFLFDNIISKNRKDFQKDAERFLNKKLDENFKTDNMFYSSNKFLLANGGIYLSKAAYDNKQPVPNFDSNHQKVIDSIEFWKEYQFFWIYEKENS